MGEIGYLCPIGRSRAAAVVTYAAFESGVQGSGGIGVFLLLPVPVWWPQCRSDHRTILSEMNISA